MLWHHVPSPLAWQGRFDSSLPGHSYDGRLCAIGPRQVYASNDHQQLRDIADAGILYYAQRQRLIEDEG